MAQGPMAMADPNFAPLGDESSDDLPRTFRREKEARAREARERAAQERAAAPSLSTTPESYGPAPASVAPHGRGQDARAHEPRVHEPRVQADPDFAPAIAAMPYPASVRRFDVPFTHLVTFFLKAVLAAIPALILLGVVLWTLGHGLQMFFPDLVKLKILIGFQG
jgi:hypothetical protein